MYSSVSMGLQIQGKIWPRITRIFFFTIKEFTFMGQVSKQIGEMVDMLPMGEELLASLI